MRLISTAFSGGDQIPIKYTKDGQNIAPPLSWEDIPDDTAELCIVFECITPSTKKPFTQWLVYGVLPQTEGFPEGLKHKRKPEEMPRAVHGKNDLGNVGYDGPLGSAGKRMYYVFRLFALKKTPGLDPGADRNAFDAAVKDKIIDSAGLNCRHERPPA